MTLKQEHMLALDVEKEKYANLLTKSSQTNDQFEALKIQYEDKEQESLTLQSYNQI